MVEIRADIEEHKERQRSSEAQNKFSHGITLFSEIEFAMLRIIELKNEISLESLIRITGLAEINTRKHIKVLFLLGLIDRRESRPYVFYSLNENGKEFIKKYSESFEIIIEEFYSKKELRGQMKQWTSSLTIKN